MGGKGEGRLAFLLRRGGTESIVFLHGLGASKSCFQPCFELEFFKDYTLAAPDLPVCGQSPCLDESSCTIGDQAGVVLQWIRRMDLEPLTIAGHSMGGVIGIYLAEALGHQVRSVSSPDFTLIMQHGRKPGPRAVARDVFSGLSLVTPFIIT
jgi:pimeloyl-ACP methyl ester carboxylesterase